MNCKKQCDFRIFVILDRNGTIYWLISMNFANIQAETKQSLIVIVIVITFYSPSCLGQETAKGPFGLRVKLPPAHLSTTHEGGFTLSL